MSHCYASYEGRPVTHLRVDDTDGGLVPHVPLVALRGRSVEPQHRIVGIWKDNGRRK